MADIRIDRQREPRHRIVHLVDVAQVLHVVMADPSMDRQRTTALGTIVRFFWVLFYGATVIHWVTVTIIEIAGHPTESKVRDDAESTSRDEPRRKRAKEDSSELC